MLGLHPVFPLLRTSSARFLLLWLSSCADVGQAVLVAGSLGALPIPDTTLLAPLPVLGPGTLPPVAAFFPFRGWVGPR